MAATRFRAAFLAEGAFLAAGFLAARAGLAFALFLPRPEALLFAPFLALAFTDFLADFLAPAFDAFFLFFCATLVPPLSSPRRREADHTIPPLSKRDPEADRVLMTARPGGLVVEIRPLVRRRGARVRLAALAAVLLGAALFGSARLAGAWEAGLKKGEFTDLPLALLIVLSAAVGVSAPAAIAGLAALAFAEERIEVEADAITFSSTAFERTWTRRIRRDELEFWRETYLPLPPWWTWAVRRLAARAGGRLHPLAGAASTKEKRRIGLALARATGKPLIGVFGRPVKPPGALESARGPSC